VEVNSINISDADYILLCNCVAHEAGATYISASEKAKVVEVIMNRVNSGSFPDSIYGVITQRSQFVGASGYANLGSYSDQVDDLVKEGVDLYLSDPENYQHGYLYFHGDGKRNYFN
jgi:spore germination cell wall hydrolase CwlJ-like protein